MVKKLTKNGTTLYVCEECGLKYRDNETAMKCEEWCREHGACNIEILSSMPWNSKMIKNEEKGPVYLHAQLSPLADG